MTSTKTLGRVIGLALLVHLIVGLTLPYILLVAGFAYVTNAVTAIVLPEYGDVVARVMTPLFFGEFPIIFWLLIKGARMPQHASTEGSIA